MGRRYHIREIALGRYLSGHSNGRIHSGDSGMAFGLVLPGSGIDLGGIATSISSSPEARHPPFGPGHRNYAANAYIKQLQDAGSQISLASAGEPSENGYAERVIRTIKEEEVYLSDYQNMAQAREEIGHFIDVVYQHITNPQCIRLPVLSSAEFGGGVGERNTYE